MCYIYNIWPIKMEDLMQFRCIFGLRILASLGPGDAILAATMMKQIRDLLNIRADSDTVITMFVPLLPREAL